MPQTYPSDPAEAALHLFRAWLGGHYARSVTVDAQEPGGDGLLVARLSVGRQWSLAVTLVSTLALEADVAWEATRAAAEKRLDAAGLSSTVWVPRGAPLPGAEPGLSDLALAVEQSTVLDDGRRELHRPVRIHLRRTSTTGSVVTVLGGLAAHWAQFTNRVPGSFQLNASALYRLPQAQEARDALAEAIVLAAGQPLADESQQLLADDCWTVNDLPGWRACVIGSPRPDTDEQSATLRRNLRKLLREAGAARADGSDASALVVLGSATYAEDEKLTWALRGMDPSLYAGYDLMAVVADGLVKPLLQPGRSTLPWDAPLPS